MNTIWLKKIRTFTKYFPMSLDLDEIYAAMGTSAEKVEQELGLEEKIELFKERNKPVSSFKDDVICACLERHFSYFRPKVYQWEFGAYFITEGGHLFTQDTMYDIFSKKSFIPPYFITRYKKDLQEQTVNKSCEESEAIKKELLENLQKEKVNYIYKRENKEQILKFYIYKKYKRLFESMGYEVEEDSSYFKKIDKESKELLFYTVYKVRIDRDAFIQMCKYGVIIRKGYRLDEKTGEEVPIKKGRPSKDINLQYGDLMLHFNSIDEVGNCLGVSRSTVKRALKDKRAGDVVILKKKEYILI